MNEELPLPGEPRNVDEEETEPDKGDLIDISAARGRAYLLSQTYGNNWERTFSGQIRVTNKERGRGARDWVVKDSAGNIVGRVSAGSGEWLDCEVTVGRGQTEEWTIEEDVQGGVQVGKIIFRGYGVASGVNG
jgi:hypothetical protein